MKFLLFSLLLVVILSETIVNKDKQCTCVQIESETDCGQKTTCQWNTTTKKCAIATVKPVVVTPTTNTTYCGGFTETDCAKKDGCAFVDKVCTHFTGCTPFVLTTNEDCALVSIKCITDGIRCVLKSSCRSYLNLTSCQKSDQPDSGNNYCYWDTKLTQCVDADTCDKLPVTLTTDKLCRDEISTCTVKPGKIGCIDSGVNCANQVEEQCFWNKLKTQACFFDGTCKDKICDNAPKTKTTDANCIEFLAECTTKLGGGCVKRTSCSAANGVQAACVTDVNSNKCYYTAAAQCVDKVCANAPTTLTTNTACKEFGDGCITKLGGGCVQNDQCATATVADACDKNQAGAACIWNVTCKDKTCANASADKTTHDLCSTYLSTCTVNSGKNGCVDRTCDNAPTTLVTNSACKDYKAGCITKLNGGCVTNGDCPVATIKDACVASSTGTVCFWDTDCKELKCTAAPTTNTTHDLCQKFSVNCTVNSSNAGCVDATCPNMLAETNCQKDKDSKLCIWRGKCYRKLCSAASTDLTTHEQCQDYNTQCTVDISLKGCVDLTLTCSGYTKEEQCKVTSLAGACGWSGTACIVKECSTARPVDNFTTNSQCDTYLKGCVINNTAKGCISLPTVCTASTRAENCPTADTTLNCVVNPTTSKCETKSCVNAPVDKATNDDCTKWLKGCMVNSTNNGCIALMSTCTGQTVTQCKKDSKSSGGCYWNGTACQDLKCSNIATTKVNHTQCNGQIDTCTVNTTFKGCVDVPSSCSGNTIYDQCYKKVGGTCSWNVTCRDKQCIDTENTNTYDDHDECTTWDKSCTVQANISTLGCVPLVKSCSDATMTQCTQTSSGQQCAWDYSKKYSSCSPLTCDLKTQSGFTQANCLAFSSTCMTNKVAPTACKVFESSCSTYTNKDSCIATLTGNCTWRFSKCIDAVCTSMKLGYGETFDHATCLLFHSTCTVNNNADGCMEKVRSCDLYTGTKEQCEGGLLQGTHKCSWASSTCSSDCINVASADIDVCLNAGCAFESGTSKCQAFKTKCDDYKGAAGIDCTQLADGSLCKWSTTCVDATLCSDIKLKTYTHLNCQKVKSTCTLNGGGTACQDKKATCAEYNTDTKSCNVTTGGTPCSIQGTNCANFTCSTTGSFAQSDCTTLNQNCYSNGDAGSKCLTRTSGCSSLTQDQCDGSCFWSSGSCITKLCSHKTGTGLKNGDCESHLSTCTMKADGTTCEDKKAACTDYLTSAATCFSTISGGLCYLEGTNCVSKTACSQLKQASLTHVQCQGFMSTCTTNDAQTECQTLLSTCGGYTKEVNCNMTSNKVACHWDKRPTPNVCIEKACHHDIVSDTHAKCNLFMAGCTIARIGGCMLRPSDCSSLLTERQCKKNLGDTNCYWNPTTFKCADDKCSSYPTAADYDSHSKCNTKNAKCTVKSTDGAIAQGCVDLAACSSYTITEQCQISSTAGICIWNSTATPKCQDKGCTTAPADSTVSTYQQCKDYYTITTGTGATAVTTYPCTASNVEAGGCQKTAACSTYKLEKACVIDDKGVVCGWNGTACAVKSCATAPATDSYDSHTKCQDYFKVCTDPKDLTCAVFTNPCTVASTGKGCVNIPATCSTMSENQCLKTSTGTLCLWNTEASPKACQQRTCDNAPTASASADDCKTHFAQCTMDTAQRCKSKVCEDFPDTTDSGCQTKLAGCTTNGVNCVTRKRCLDSKSASGCVTDKDSKTCYWLAHATVPYCDLKTCDTAPPDMKTETACNTYLSGCTTKSGGGCVTKTTCLAATVNDACTTNSSGGKCVWASACRDVTCIDLSGSTHAACKTAGGTLNCTTDGSNKCIEIKKCADTLATEACIEGIDGPCLWVQTTPEKGTCYPYTACTSVKLLSHAQCQKVSPKCTGSATSCVAISGCTGNNTSGGCILGTDGDCIQSVASLTSTTGVVCKPFTSCSDAFYLTHQACQSASSKCTTNKVTGCTALGPCNGYIEESCYKTALGEVRNTDNQITSTGICVFDKTVVASGTCRDQKCSDLKGTSHSDCVAKLLGCTSDGTNCLQQASCDTYLTADICGIAYSTAGPCISVPATTTGGKPTCRQLECSDILGGSTLAVCSGRIAQCTSDGIKCLVKPACASLLTKTGCANGGTDGICVWTATSATTGTCALMTSCNSSDLDQTACNKNTTRCKWVAATSTTGSKCNPQTCATLAVGTQCVPVISWDGLSYTVCSLVNNVCTPTDPTTLKQTDCYRLSVQSYTWNSVSSKCSVCQSVVVVTPDGIATNNNDGSSTNQSILGAAIFITLAMFW